jgi:hypothetical protein
VCHYHPGKPIFHDLKKGWTCCNRIVYDWDEFQKLPTCATAKHTDQKEEGNEFFKSSTVQNAANAIKKEEANVVIRDINEYNKGTFGVIQSCRRRRSWRRRASRSRKRRSS